MKILLLIISLFITGCAASLKFIDQETGDQYHGKTGGTATSNGKMTAEIENESYVGNWVYQASGGSFTLGTSSASVTGSGGYASAYGTSSAVSAPMSGSGLMTMQGNKGSHVRCVFTFNTMSATGMGQCLKNNKKKFDIIIIR